MQYLRSRFVVVLLLGVAGVMPACSGDMRMPVPAPLMVHRETDDWVRPGTNAILKGRIAEGWEAGTFRVLNRDTFTWHLLDDIWLVVRAPNVQILPSGPSIGDGRNGWYVYLRCLTPRTIAPGHDLEISMDACRPTTHEPGPGATVTGDRIVAKEGARISDIEPEFSFIRPNSPQGPARPEALPR